MAGHGSVPLETNALAHLGEAVGKIAAWTPPMRLNETTAAYFKRLATVSSPEEAERYRALLSPDPKMSGPADDYMRKNEPRHWSMLRTSLSPTIIGGGYRTNVIPSEGTATIDTRLAPDEDPTKFLELVKQVVNDPQVEVSYGARDTRPPTPTAKLDSDAFKALEAEHHEALQGGDAADDEHRRHRHGVPAPQGHPVLRHRARHRQRRRPEGLRRAQRPGAHPRKRAVSASSASTGTPSSISHARRGTEAQTLRYPESRKGDVVDQYGSRARRGSVSLAGRSRFA